MTLLRLLAVFLALLAQTVLAQTAQPAAPAATKRPAKIATEAFTEASMLRNMRLSPDGKLIALRTKTTDDKVNMAILDAASKVSLASMVMPEKLELEWYRWAGNQRLLISMSFTDSMYERRFTRLFVYDVPTKSLSFVGRKNGGIDGKNVVLLEPQGGIVMLSTARVNCGERGIIGSK